MKKIKAFKITAKNPAKSWENFARIIRAENESEAMQKFQQISTKLTPEHKLEASSFYVCSSYAKLSTDSYPYGRLRTTAHFSVEYKKNKGFRSCFQTVNPKTGRLNAVKCSTYSNVILPAINDEGFISFIGHLSFNGTAELNEGLMFMSDFFELFTADQIKDIALLCLSMHKANSIASVQYAGADFNQIKPLIEKSIKTLVQIANTGENLFSDCLIDEQAMEATKQPNFNPFKVVEYSY